MDLSRALEGLSDSWRLLSVASVGSLELDGTLVSGTGGASAYCNQIIVSRDPADIRATLAEGIAYFDARGLPFLVQTLSGSATEAALPDLGLAPVDSNPLMVMDPIVGSGRRNDVTMVRVRSIEDLEPLLAILTEAFSMPPADVASFQLERFIGRDDVYMYTGWVEGEPATTATAVRIGDMAGIFSVGTFQRFRKRGLGEAVTAWAIDAASQDGARTAFLQASALGFPIYERMGFKSIARHTMHARVKRS